MAINPVSDTRTRQGGIGPSRNFQQPRNRGRTNPAGNRFPETQAQATPPSMTPSVAPPVAPPSVGRPAPVRPAPLHSAPTPAPTPTPSPIHENGGGVTVDGPERPQSQKHNASSMKGASSVYSVYTRSAKLHGFESV